ncbi:hypothetical protein [Pseudoroseicyclus sp. CXY001]|uniref:hypothetical protein n=1 Tax=Pseudoroseicyclus sp. CXY001 TaxID=3242492 RepID=UPI0035715860
MRAAGLLLAALLFAAAPAAAQTVTMRSGQHPTFTRLVLAVPEGQDWRLGRGGAGYLLDLGEGIDFDPGGVFARVPRDRLLSLEDRGEGVLELGLACEPCHATIFRWQPDRLVLDIRDGAAPADSPNEAPLPPAADLTTDMAADIDAAPPDPRPAPAAPASTPAATPGPGPTEVARPSLPVVLAPPGPAETLLPFGPAVTIPESLRVAQMEADILQSLSRAATLGLIELQPQMPGMPEPVPPLLAPADAPPEGPEGGTPGEPGLSFRTSLDRDRAIAPAHNSCLPEALFDMATWVPEEADFPSAIGPLRIALTGEFDRPNAGAAEDLAKAYLYFGFGAEAREVLALDTDPSVAHRVLIALAALVDGRPAPSGILDGQIGCGQKVALWAALAGGSVEGIAEEQRAAIMLAYRTLPPPLQGHIGARLAQIFIQSGDSFTAESLLDLARPAVTGDSPEAQLTEAEVTGALEGPEAELEDLNALVDDSATLSPEVLIRAIDRALELGQVPSDRQIALAGSLRFEQRGTADDARLADAEIRALTAATRFEEALDLIADSRHPMPAGRRAVLADAALAALTEKADDLRFLDHAMGPLPRGLGADTENAMAARLLALGFPEQAEVLMAGRAEGADGRERQYLRAEAALLRGDGAAVVAALDGFSDPRARSLIARAAEVDGDYAAALAAEAEPQAETMWRAGAWDALAAQEDDPLLSGAAADVLRPTEIAPEATPLAGRADLIGEAEATRTMVEDLLARFPVDGD